MSQDVHTNIHKRGDSRRTTKNNLANGTGIVAGSGMLQSLQRHFLGMSDCTQKHSGASLPTYVLLWACSEQNMRCHLFEIVQSGVLVNSGELPQHDRTEWDEGRRGYTIGGTAMVLALGTLSLLIVVPRRVTLGKGGTYPHPNQEKAGKLFWAQLVLNKHSCQTRSAWAT